MNLDHIRDKATITVAQAAELLGMDERSVRRGIDDGTIPGVRVGRRILIPVPRLLAQLEPKHIVVNDSPPEHPSRGPRVEVDGTVTTIHLPDGTIVRHDSATGRAWREKDL